MAHVRPPDQFQTDAQFAVEPGTQIRDVLLPPRSTSPVQFRQAGSGGGGQGPISGQIRPGLAGQGPESGKGRQVDQGKHDQTRRQAPDHQGEHQKRQPTRMPAV